MIRWCFCWRREKLENKKPRFLLVALCDCRVRSKLWHRCRDSCIETFDPAHKFLFALNKLMSNPVPLVQSAIRNSYPEGREGWLNEVLAFMHGRRCTKLKGYSPRKESPTTYEATALQKNLWNFACILCGG